SRAAFHAPRPQVTSRERAPGTQRIVHLDDVDVGRAGAAPLDHEEHGALLGRVLEEGVAIAALAAHRDERVAGLDGAAVSRDSHARGRARGARGGAPAGRDGRLVRVERGPVLGNGRGHHAPPARREASARRASTRSSKGSFVVPTTWYGSCPLPATST